MANEIRPIETQYKGYRFRSRLEARWAVFFDALGVAWEYEKQGYALASGAYLPDFWLPRICCWIEIKGEAPTETERALASELALHTESRVFIFSGSVPSYSTDWNAFWSKEPVDAYLPHRPLGRLKVCWDNFYAFCICEDCGAVGIEFEARTDRLPCKECYTCGRARHGMGVTGDAPCGRGGCGPGRCRLSGHGDRGAQNFDHPRILDAVVAARSARFEHGESPR